MTSIILKLKKLSQNNKVSLFFIVSFFVVSIILCIKATYAYYNNSTSTSLIRSLIGNFYMGDGDVNIIVFKEDSEGEYVKSYAVPAYGFELSNVSCTVQACETTNSNANCYYTYNAQNNIISITSNQKVSCNFYFDEITTSDINILIYIENILTSTNPKTYKLANEIPAYGYVFSSASCENGVIPTYNANTRTFNIATSEKTNCSAYFDTLGVGLSDITAHIYVESEYGSAVYTEVQSIPANKIYQISTDLNHISTCVKESDGTASSAPTYVDGYINISATEAVTCTVYLDLVS